MSASTERKNRIAAKADGTHKKTIAMRKEEEKKKKDKIKWTIIGTIIVLFFAAIIFLNTGAFYRNATAVSVDIEACEADGFSIPAEKVNYSIAEVSYVFQYNYSNFINQYGSMASYLGLNTGSPLKDQACMMGGGENEDYTWYDYFMDATMSQLKSYAVTSAYAKAAGIELSDDAKAEIDNAVKSLAEGAKANGYSLNKYLANVYGKGCNESVFRDVLEMEYIAMAVQDTISNAKDYSAEEISAHYLTVADDYDFYNYSFYLVAAETETGEDGTAAAPTEEAMAAAKGTAEQIMAAVKAGDLEAAVIDVLGEDVVPQHDDTVEGEAEEGHVHTASTANTDVQGNSIETDLAAWLKSADRQNGDIEVVEAANQGYYVVIFNGRHTQTEPTEESGDVPYCDYIAEQLLRQADFEAWSSSVYNAILDGVSVSEKFFSKYIG
ncbi:MAG: hypothetical protein Q4A83_05885 [Bacillota bacterium]|nr:hypothetical protein [Bacillota bacterium]